MSSTAKLEGLCDVTDHARLVERLINRAQTEGDRFTAQVMLEAVAAIQALSPQAGSGVPEGDDALKEAERLCRERAEYFRRTSGHYDREQAARSYDATADKISRLSASPLSGDGGVAVKALEWLPLSKGDSYASTPFGDYFVEPLFANGAPIFQVRFNRDIVANLQQEETAKAAAQSDLATRWSALAAPVPSPAQPVGIEPRCAKCNDSGTVAIRSSNGTYSRPGSVPDNSKNFTEADCWFCDLRPGGFDGPTGAN